MKKQFTSNFLVLLILTVPTVSIMAQKQKPPVFNHAALYVLNLQKSAAFYRDVLGLDTIAEPFKDGKHAWFSIGGGKSLHIIEGASAASIYSRHSHICFSVQSVPEFVKMLEKNRITFEDRDGKPNAVTRRPDGVNQIYFKDPDNYWIEINDDKY